MPDREKAIKGLKCCTKWDSCKDCPYETPNEYDIAECTEHLHKDALELLKSSDELIRDYQRKLDNATGALVNATKIIKSQPEIVRCKDCKHIEHLSWLDDETGRAVICRKHNFTGLRSDDWFCADGERK